MKLAHSLAALALLALAAPLFSQGFVGRPIDEEPDMRRRPRPLPVQLEIRAHNVETTIDGQAATTTVTQTFFNPGQRVLQGEYVFPLPANASVSGFEMTMNGKLVKGELLDAQKARQTYENIVRQYLDPGLLEFVGRGCYKASVFPINPREEMTIKITYSELLPYDSGLVRFAYPLRTRQYSPLPVASLSMRVTLKSPSALRTLYSPTHNCEIIRKGDSEAVVGFELRNVQPENDFELYFGTAQEAVSANVMSWREGDEGYFLALLTPKIKLADDEIVARDVVVVLDTSGSMSDDGKIDQARKAVKFIVGTLSDKDHFGLVTFATESRKWKDSLVLAGRDEREAAAKFVDGLQATGGTNIEQALADGLALARGGNDKRRPCYVIFLTDGLPTVQNTDVKAIAKGAQAGREEHIRLFTFGVGYDVNTWLLDTLAEQGRGQREYVKPKEDMELKVSNFAAKVSSPVLSDIKLRIDGAEVSLVEPRTLPDLFAGTQLSVLGRYAKPGRHAVVLEGQVNGARRVYEYTCEFAEKDTSKNYLPRMWAVRRVGYLLDQINVGGFSQELKDEIVKLASRFGIVTPYTSFLIVEDAPLPPARGERPQPRDAGWGERRAIEPRREAGLGGGRGSGDAPQSATGKEKVEESRNNAERRQNDNADGVKDADDKARDELEKKAEAGGFARKTGARAKRLKDAGYTKEVAEAEAANTIKTIGTRTFVWCDDVWVEADITNAELIAATVVEYLSDDYFALAKANDANAKILALGSEVVFRDGKKVVRVYVPQPADSKDDKK